MANALSDRAIEALSDPTRRRIFERMRSGPRSVGDLAKGLPVSRPAVSQHLRVLHDAQLVRVEQVGTRRLYSVDFRALNALRSYLDSFWGDVLEAFKAAAENPPPKKGT